MTECNMAHASPLGGLSDGLSCIVPDLNLFFWWSCPLWEEVYQAIYEANFVLELLITSIEVLQTCLPLFAHDLHV